MGAESAKVNQEYFQAVSKAGGDPKVYAKAAAERKAALEKLIERAEKEKVARPRRSGDGVSSRTTIRRCRAEARAAVAARAGDLGSQTVLISSLSQLGKLEEAEKALIAAQKAILISRRSNRCGRRSPSAFSASASTTSRGTTHEVSRLPLADG